MAKTNYVPVRVDDDLKAQLDAETKRSGRSLSETIRSILRGFFRKAAAK